MLSLQYLLSKLIKKSRGSSIKNSKIHSTSKVETGCNISGVIMDRHSFCGYDCEITNCHIGSFCSIANNVKIGGGEHPVNWVSTSPVFYEGRDSVKTKFSKHKRPPFKQTVICHDVWIGEGAMIKQGVKIGTGAVIGMGSIVTRDVLPFQIVAGNPAKMIRYRFSSDIIAKIIALNWWDASDSDLKRYAKFFNNPDQFIEMFEE